MPDRADVREEARRLAAVRLPKGDPPEVDRARRCRSSATRTASSKRGRDAVGARRSPGRCRRQDGELGVRARRRRSRPRSASRRRRRRRAAVRRRAASRASSVRCPGRSESSASPVEPELLRAPRSFGQRLPGRAVALAGLTRKTRLRSRDRLAGLCVAGVMRRSRRRARAASSGRRRPAAPRR